MAAPFKPLQTLTLTPASGIGGLRTHCDPPAKSIWTPQLRLEGIRRLIVIHEEKYE